MKMRNRSTFQMWKFKLYMAAVLFLCLCKDAPVKPSIPLEKYAKECKSIEINKYGDKDFYFGKTCIQNKEDLTCMKAIKEIKENGIDFYFFGKVWDRGSSQQAYHVNKNGEFTIIYHGPDGRRVIWKRKGKFIKKNNIYYLSTPQGPTSLTLEEFPIKRIDCEINDGNFESEGSFIYFTFSSNELIQLRNSQIDNSPIYGYSESFNMGETTKPLPNPELWHSISLIFTE